MDGCFVSIRFDSIRSRFRFRFLRVSLANIDCSIPSAVLDPIRWERKKERAMATNRPTRGALATNLDLGVSGEARKTNATTTSRAFDALASTREAGKSAAAMLNASDVQIGNFICWNPL